MESEILERNICPPLSYLESVPVAHWQASVLYEVLWKRYGASSPTAMDLTC